MVSKKQAPSSQKKIRIVVKAFEHKLVDEATKKITLTIKDSGAMVVGPIPLPTKIEKITLNRSTFASKNAREQFEIRRHKRIIDILEPNPQIQETLRSIHLPTGVGIDIKIA